MIVAGILAAVAFPRFFKTIEFSKNVEALTNFRMIREALERCYLNDQDYRHCTTWEKLSISDPTNNPGANFTYQLEEFEQNSYLLSATSKKNPLDKITFEYTGSGFAVAGQGIYSGLH